MFLFYAQLGDFTSHWPPSMGFTQWMLFCKDSETSGGRGGRGLCKDSKTGRKWGGGREGGM